MKTALHLLLYMLLAAGSYAQTARVILIGDAGLKDDQQQQLMRLAAEQVLPGRTTVLFLGDNVYPRGMNLPGQGDSTWGQGILRSQYEPMRAKGAPVYFIPGNHDWDRMGPDGLAKIKLQWQFLEAQNDPLLKLVPADGCPDPVEIEVSDSLSIIAFDSEWWLFPYPKNNPGAECACQTKADVAERMQALLYKNRHKVVLLASHHPFETYGVHGGRFSFKDHLFPLTAANKNLYIPLPLVGSLYPLLRTVFTNAEDKGHPLYRDMIRQVGKAAEAHQNMVHVSGHDHGLQLIEKEILQVVSGSGAKNSATYKGKGSLYATSHNGFVVADLMPGNQLLLKYFTVEGERLDNAYTYTKNYSSVAEQELSVAQTYTKDSATVAIKPAYDSVSRSHRRFFGENYRKEWATPTTIPVIRVSSIMGGLKPTKRGGGMQTKSLRLEDAKGNEWVLRSVEKAPDVLLPEGLKETFASDWVEDAMSAQHPYSALVMPPLAKAAGVPHAEPIIGIVAPDPVLGEHNVVFANKVCLLEKREPIGSSDNTLKMLEKIRSDNDDTFDGEMWLRARLLDILVEDWDRHEDQWRWADTKKGKNKFYLPVPRDRDQVFHKTEGWFPKLASRQWLVPTLQGFDERINSARYSLFKTKFLDPYPATQLSDERWLQVVNEFVSAMTDEVLEEALSRLPAEQYALRHDELLRNLKGRRSEIVAAMQRFRKFISRKMDIAGSDKNELLSIKEDASGNLEVLMQKINKDGELKDTLMHRTFSRAVTSELRFYLFDGHDSVHVAKNSGHTKLRFIGGKKKLPMHFEGNARNAKVYARPGKLLAYGDTTGLRKKLGTDSLHTALVPVNLYNTWMPLLTIGLNLDDGFILGGGFRYTGKSGFRKLPYTHIQEFMLAHSFSTSAYRMRYRGEWNQLVGKADLTLNAMIRAPDNTINFFGRGNETDYKKTGEHIKFHRTRFSVYQFDPGFQWRKQKGFSYFIGPSLQYYKFDAEDNDGRFIQQTGKIGSYDSVTVNKAKFHLGLTTGLELDKRNNVVLTNWGYRIALRLQAYKGMNGFSEDFAQLVPEISVYNNLNARSTIVMGNRIGGGVTFGRSAFYQSMFLGGQNNLLGYRQYRFAGDHNFYHNLELRIKLANVASYILPGQAGFVAFNDLGRVWQKNEVSHRWHHGFGGGLYFSPAQLAVFNLLVGKSKEGFYPYFSMGLRF